MVFCHPSDIIGKGTDPGILLADYGCGGGRQPETGVNGSGSEGGNRHPRTDWNWRVDIMVRGGIINYGAEPNRV